MVIPSQDDIFKDTPLVDEEEEDEDEDEEEEEEEKEEEEEEEEDEEEEDEDDDDEEDEEEIEKENDEADQDNDEEEEDDDDENDGEETTQTKQLNQPTEKIDNKNLNDTNNSINIDIDSINKDEDTPMTDAEPESQQKQEKQAPPPEEEEEEDEQEQPKLNQSDESFQKNYYDTLYLKAKISDSFEILPVAAIPYACGINSICLPKSSKWLFTGGDDGYIRRYDFFGSIDGEVQLTAAQKHSVVDSVTNAGSLIAYWENEIPVKRSSISKDVYEPKLSPVFSLAVENKCLWLLSGLSDGGINLQSIRQNEGAIVHHFKEHDQTVSVLKLNDKEDKFLSGSWDKIINRYDLNTGKVIDRFTECTGQISSLEYRPNGGIGLDQIQSNNDDEDDDMGSLFGDEEEKEDKETKETKEEKNRSISATPSTDDNVFLSSAIDGSLNIWDVRTGKCALRIKSPKGTPPWCVSACWSTDGDSIFVGRRNSTVEEFSLKMPSTPSKVLKFPQVSGAVSVVESLPNSRHILCGSQDNIRIYDLALYNEAHKKTPFLIVPGHHGGVLSDVVFDPTYRYMVSSSGNRGWQGTSTETVFIYNVGLD